MNRVGIGVRLGIRGVLLGALAAQTTAPADAQPTSEQELTDRIGQIQGGAAPGAGQPAEEAAAPDLQAIGQEAQELIGPIRAMRREAQPDAAAGAPPALGADEVRTLMRTNLGVEVLEVELVDNEGRPAYAVTVMHPPGNYNGAFLVERLLVDGATGGLLGRVPQRPRVASGAAEPSGQADFDGSGLEIRRRSHR
jgi:hypothetical protein